MGGMMTKESPTQRHHREWAEALGRAAYEQTRAVRNHHTGQMEPPRLNTQGQSASLREYSTEDLVAELRRRGATSSS
jgi:hypothetical protein